MSDTDCVFCAKIRDERLKPDYFDFNYGVEVVSFEPRNPVTPGHRLFAPTRCLWDAAAWPAATGVTFAAASDYGRYKGEQFNLITSVGPLATQTVRHLHVHYVPRREGDGLALPWTGQEKRP